MMRGERDELGMNMAYSRAVIESADVDKAREYALALLDEVREARLALVATAAGERIQTNPIVLWDAAVAALRELSHQPAILLGPGVVEGNSAMLARAADWLAAIGPATTKLPCRVCLKPTDHVCLRCGRYLCTPHSALNAPVGTHDGGRLACVL